MVSSDRLGVLLERIGRPFAPWLDQYVYIKNAYTIWTHLIPLAIAALILLVVSLPSGDVIISLVNVLQDPNPLWIPVLLLTGIASLVYWVSLRVQISRAYLWPDRDATRTAGTFLLCVFLGTLISFIVLWPQLEAPSVIGTLWACFLVAVLSLTGIGWTRAENWVEAVGIVPPDYLDGRTAAEVLTGILSRVRSSSSSPEDIGEFADNLSSLIEAVRENIRLEPAWSQVRIRGALELLETLDGELESNFLSASDATALEFAPACRFQMQYRYGDFVDTLRALGGYWHDWRYEKGV